MIQNSIPGYISKGKLRPMSTQKLKHMFMAALFAIVQRWKQPSCHLLMKR